MLIISKINTQYFDWFVDLVYIESFMIFVRTSSLVGFLFSLLILRPEQSPYGSNNEFSASYDFSSRGKLVKSSAKAVHLISLPSTSMPVMSLFCLMATRRDSKAKINRLGERIEVSVME